MKKTGLFFGSFNPIHMGHLVIAQSMLEEANLEEVWFVVSPQNPFKETQSLLQDTHRLRMVELSIKGNPHLRACDIEFHLPTPSYTATTLRELAHAYPEKDFCIIMGSDNLSNFHRWRESQFIINNYELFVYPRPNHCNPEWIDHPRVHLVEVPMLDISSTYIRGKIARGKNIQYLVPEAVMDYIADNNFYIQ